MDQVMRTHSRVELAMSDEEIGRLAAHCALGNGGGEPRAGSGNLDRRIGGVSA
jgi:hypothetical protein